MFEAPEQEVKGRRILPCREYKLMQDIPISHSVSNLSSRVPQLLLYALLPEIDKSRV